MGITKGTTIMLMKGDARSLDNGLYGLESERLTVVFGRLRFGVYYMGY